MPLDEQPVRLIISLEICAVLFRALVRRAVASVAPTVASVFGRLYNDAGCDSALRCILFDYHACIWLFGGLRTTGGQVVLSG